jgi:RNA polymerase sigma factor (sigma-70 family)
MAQGAVLARSERGDVPPGRPSGSAQARAERRAALEHLSLACVRWRDALRAELASLPLVLAKAYASDTGETERFAIPSGGQHASSAPVARARRNAQHFLDEAGRGRISRTTRAQMQTYIAAQPLAWPVLVERTEWLLKHASQASRLSPQKRFLKFGSRSPSLVVEHARAAARYTGAWIEDSRLLATLWMPWLKGFAAKRFPANADGRNVFVQEAWRYIVRGLDLYQPERGVSAMTYCYTWVRLATLREAHSAAFVWGGGAHNGEEEEHEGETLVEDVDGLRLQSFYEALSGDIPLSVAPDPVAIVAQAERTHLLSQAMRILPVKQRSALECYYGFADGVAGDLTYSEIGQRFGYSRQRAQVLVSDAVHHLREHIDQTPGVAEALHAELMAP